MMMKELSLHVLDIMQNSIVAGATLIIININVQNKNDKMFISVQDNGHGMDEAFLKKVVDPFTTKRTTRKVGLGIPMFKAGAEGAGGAFTIKSVLNEGTFIKAEYQISHLDRPPLGDIAETIYTQVVCNHNIDFILNYTVDSLEYTFDTREIRSVLGEAVPLNMPEVALWIKDELSQGINALCGGV